MVVGEFAKITRQIHFPKIFLLDVVCGMLVAEYSISIRPLLLHALIKLSQKSADLMNLAMYAQISERLTCFV